MAARHRFRDLGAAATSRLLLGALLGTTMTIAPAAASESSPVFPGAKQLTLSANAGTRCGHDCFSPRDRLFSAGTAPQLVALGGSTGPRGRKPLARGAGLT